MARQTQRNPKKSGSKKTKGNSRSDLKRRLLKYGLFAFLGMLFLLFALFGAVYVGLFGRLPSEEDLKEVRQANASEVFSSDGELLGKYFIQNRSSVSYQEIPQMAVDALVATEDSRFFEHEGIDFYSIPRVVIKTILLGDRSSGGGSTISQQLVKNLFGRKDYGALSMPVNKLKENITALKLEEIYTKEEIITLYLNTVSFGENVYGIKAASLRFFNKLPSELSPTEIATLIGMLKANTSYNPRLYPEASKERRNTVLALMAKEEVIAEEQVEALQAEPIKLDYQGNDSQYGSAQYLRAYLKSTLESILSTTDRGDGKPYNLSTDGLQIFLTVNKGMQAYAEKAVHERMKELQKTFESHWKDRKPWGKDWNFLWKEARKSNRYNQLKEAGKSDKEIETIFTTPTEIPVFTYDGYETRTMSPLDSVAYHQMILQAGFMAMDAKTGKVLAYVGGVDFHHFPYDHVQSKRQVGSTFKPFVYTAALEAGFSPCDYIENQTISFPDYDNWTPENAGGEYGGLYTIKGGLANSVNVVAARLIAETGVAPVRDVARRAGIESNLPRVPAIALGVADLSLSEMVTSYAVFANEGRAVKPWFIEKILSSKGEVIYESKPPKSRSALDAEVAIEMREMLELVVDSGTARSVRFRYNVKTELGGKTGTTQNNADGWFIAISPKIVCGSWVGGESPIVRFRSTGLGQGAATALPIVASFIKSSENDRKTARILGWKFPETDADIQLELFCPLHVESRTEFFLDQLFDPDTRQEKRELKEKVEAQENADSDKEGGWMKGLIDKLRKRKKR